MCNLLEKLEENNMISLINKNTLNKGDSIMLDSDICIVRQYENGKLYTVDGYGNIYEEHEIMCILNSRIES